MLTNKKSLGVLTAVFFLLAAAVPLASARMDPLREIKAQVKAPNMLIILDTSGSMEWPPDQDSNNLGGDNTGSRIYQVKEVVRNVVRDSHTMMNFGLMTWDQTHKIFGDSRGYFPYYISSGTCTTKIQFFQDDDLMRWGQFTRAGGPVSSFTRQGTAYTLYNSTCPAVSGDTYATGCNSSFRRNTRHRGHADTEHTYVASECRQNRWGGNVTCDFGGYGTWEYRGSYYTYQSCPVSSNIAYLPEYLGEQFTDDAAGSLAGTANQTYVYYDFGVGYNHTSNSCGGNGDSIPVDCGDSSGILLVRISTDPADQDNISTDITRWMDLENNGGLVARGGTPMGPTLENSTTDPTPTAYKKLFTNVVPTSPSVGDGTTAPPTEMHWGSDVWLYVNTQYKETVKGSGCGTSVGNLTTGAWSTYGSGYTASGCTYVYVGHYYNSENSTKVAYNDAYHYFYNEVIPNDSASLGGCRKNYILLVTDGEPNGSGDPDTSYNAATDLKNMTVSGHTTPVKTYVVGFGTTVATSSTLGTIAADGGTVDYYKAGNEAALEDAIRAIIADAAKGDYTTAPPSYTFSSGGTGTIVFFSSAQYPQWYGHLRAVDATNNKQAWDAGTLLASRNSNTRKIYTSDPASTPAYPLAFTDSGPNNLTALRNLGLGSSDDEARQILYFIRGTGDNWPLGDIVNSAPATLVPPPWRQLGTFGYPTFFNTYGYHLVSGQWVPQRNILVFTGANDGMLHAFTLVGFTFGGFTYKPGDEVWAYIPPNLIPRLKDLYMNNGQIADPAQHLYYVAASPKIEDIYVDTNSDGVNDTWKTELVFGEGPGGSQIFALDVTHPSPTDAGYGFTSDYPFQVLWNSYDPTNQTSNNLQDRHKSGLENLGETWSNPAYGKVKYISGGQTRTEDAIFMGSGYDDTYSGYDPSTETKTTYNSGNHTDSNHINVGNTAFILRAQDGTVIKSFNATPPNSGLLTAFSLVPNTVAYGYGSMFGWSTSSGGVDTWNLSDLLQADLGGKLWTATTSGSTTTSTWSMTASYDAGAGQPFYYSPAMATIPVAGNTYVNILAAISGVYDDADLDSYGAGSGFTPKVFLLQDVNGTITDFPNYPKLLTAFSGSSAFTLYNSSGTQIGTYTPPASARPTGSPLIAIDDNNTPADMSDDFVAVVLTLFVPPNQSTSPCSYGEGYLVILKITGLYNSGVSGATVTQAFAQKVSDSKPSPPFIVKGALVMTESGHGNSTATISTIGTVETPITTGANAVFLYWKEVR